MFMADEFSMKTALWCQENYCFSLPKCPKFGCNESCAALLLEPGFCRQIGGPMARVSTGLTRLARRLDLPVQVAAVCYRETGLSVEFLLVNTSSGKWTFPKGRLSPSLTPSESAAREAWEEAGAKGRIAQSHFASYLDTKRALQHDLGTSRVLISAYLFEVHRTETPQEDGRNPSWFSPRDAK